MTVVSPYLVRLSLLAIVSLYITFPMIGRAQSQPPVATNNQDELLHINRAVEADTDTFRILRSGDKREITHYVSKVYRLEHANPFEIIPYIQSIVNLEKGSVATARNPGPDGEIRMWIQVNVPEYLIPFMDQTVRAYDVPNFISAPGFCAFSYRTQHRDAEVVANFMRISASSNEGRMTSDPITNTIYFQESPSDFRRVYSAIRFVDIPVSQIDLEVQLVELTDNDQTVIGLDWEAWKASIGGDITGRAQYERINPDDPALSKVHRNRQSLDAIASIGATTLARFLNYLIDQGKAEIVIETTLTVSNLETALLQSTTDVADIEYVFDPAQDKNILAETDRKQEGVFIRISPIVAMESARLAIEVEINSPVGLTKADLPIYSTQTASSTLTVSQDQLYKIGGLTRGVLADQTNGIPFLKEVPFIKRLFSREAKIVRQTDLYLFIKPVWSAPVLPDRYWADFHGLVEPFDISNLLKENPNLMMSPDDAEVLQNYFDSKRDDMSAYDE